MNNLSKIIMDSSAVRGERIDNEGCVIKLNISCNYLFPPVFV